MKKYLNYKAPSNKNNKNNHRDSKKRYRIGIKPVIEKYGCREKGGKGESKPQSAFKS